VQTLDHADDLAGRVCDVHVVLHGLAAVRRTAGQRHVLWIISHPETVDVGECDAADLVLVASRRFADELRTRTTTPVDVMLQATDTDRFRPLDPDPRAAHDVVVVAKTRDIARSIVTDAIAAGLRPAIYGSGWERFVDPGLVVRTYVPNEELPIVYASAGVVLNDHWDEMREHGFVSNRLFDALACGAPVVSDELPEIAELFGDAVVTYHDTAELRDAVTRALADPDAARARARSGGDIVRAAHSMDHRAVELLAALARHGFS
jgi:spore maturation protein CgeB